MTRQEGGQWSIGFVRARTAWVGALGVAGAAVVRALRRQPSPAPAADPRAEELRQKLAESRAWGDGRDEFEPAEPPVEGAEVDARRRSVHERGRAAAEQMRGDAAE